MKTAQLLIAALVMGLGLGMGVGDAQAGEKPFHDQPASPRSVPGDLLPPFAMLDDSGKLAPLPPLPPGGLHMGPGSPPESTAPGPTLVQATAAARAAIAACSAAGYRVGVTVIDSVGEARAMLTADGSDGSHVFVAMRKALAALAFGMPSSEANSKVPADPALLARVTPAMFVEGGALPIYAGKEIVGAIGVSGAAGQPIGHQDEVCAAAAISRMRIGLR